MIVRNYHGIQISTCQPNFVHTSICFTITHTEHSELYLVEQIKLSTQSCPLDLKTAGRGVGVGVGGGGVGQKLT